MRTIRPCLSSGALEAIRDHRERGARCLRNARTAASPVMRRLWLDRAHANYTGAASAMLRGW